MVTSPTGKGIIAMGGTTGSRKTVNPWSKALFELSDSMQWTRLEQTWQYDHYYPLVIPIPNELLFEVKQVKNSDSYSQHELANSSPL